MLAKKKEDRNGQIWLELSFKLGDEEYNRRQIDAGNEALRRLFGQDTPLKFWRAQRYHYNLTTSEAGTYIELADDGHWFDMAFNMEG